MPLQQHCFLQKIAKIANTIAKMSVINIVGGQ